MDQMHRIKMKIAGAEFEAEGDPEAIKQQFAEFMAAIAKIPNAAPVPPSPAATPNPPAAPPAAINNSDQPPNTAQQQTALTNVSGNGGSNGNGGLDRALLERVFMQGEPLSLAARPNTENAGADGLLVLLYGYAKLKGEQQITGVMLMKSAEKSGLGLERVDRSFGKNAQYIMTAGANRGRRYSLNNRGLIEAERIIREMVQ